MNKPKRAARSAKVASKTKKHQLQSKTHKRHREGSPFRRSHRSLTGTDVHTLLHFERLHSKQYRENAEIAEIALKEVEERHSIAEARIEELESLLQVEQFDWAYERERADRLTDEISHLSSQLNEVTVERDDALKFIARQLMERVAA